MYRRFIATIAAASIAITATGALPAAAGERDAARAIAAILGVAVIGSIIHDKNKRKKQARHHTPAPVYQDPSRHRPAPVYQPPRYDNHTPSPRPLPNRVNRKLLPKQCFRSYDARGGKVRMFSERCLKRNFDFAHRLPRGCQYVFSTHRGDRRGYDARCLRNKGYRLARG